MKAIYIKNEKRSKMLVSVLEMIRKSVVKEDASGRNVLKPSFTFENVVINTDNIVSIKKLDDNELARILREETNLNPDELSSVYINRGGVSSSEIIIKGSPEDFMKKVNGKKKLLND